MPAERARRNIAALVGDGTMGIVGGALGYRVLRRISPCGERGWVNCSAYAAKSKLETLLGRSIWSEIAGKAVIDFGCGEGAEAIEMAQRGARRIIGLDIQEPLLETARSHAKERGVEDRCEFVTRTDERTDVITAIDSFEHFDEPGAVLEEMRKLLRPGGYVWAAFGPTW